jgi:hypothetical protein
VRPYGSGVMTSVTKSAGSAASPGPTT